MTAHLSPHAASEWMHEDHPVVTPLSGFYAGLAFVIVVPALFATVLNALFPRHTVEDLFPLVVLALGVPIWLLARQHTRRFGLYFCLGMAATAVVVFGVGWLVLWALMS
ncbi:hypothetical protein [Nocardioides sp. Kera G14]|uniref:hypothetical protein n=1 Tax=Nocardioides sp. Kera G14 TaxID=2884264 RepID=UPI001D115668|nr:hypothetical protein [Nocardioides sp. Kera G14]UDY22623.1 hypothetical protein LH076_11115 [Nocardioides sp. Kera G14]